MTSSPIDYQKRRQHLLNILDENSLVIISSGQSKQRSTDVYYPFRANSDFLYLVGVNEPNIIALISWQYFVLFINEKTQKQIIWEGESLTISQAKDELKADQAYALGTLEKKLPNLLLNHCIVAYNFGQDLSLDGTIIRAVAKISSNRQGKNYPVQYHSLNLSLYEMRLMKQPQEISHIQQAVNISIAAHKQAMQTIKSWRFEYEVVALFDHTFAKQAAQHAYPPIVATGINTCTLHYTRNNQALKNGDLLLIDAGAEVAGYASDITRTFPVNGYFSKRQSLVYEIVLRAQKEAIAAIKPGVSVDTPHKITTKMITEGLREIGLLKPHSTKKDLKQFFMHGTAHWLGLDVHDVGAYQINGKHRYYEAGMITTIEPGIYIRPHNNTHPKWWGIGVRIEDDILVTKTGRRNLSEPLVKEIDDIQKLIQ